MSRIPSVARVITLFHKILLISLLISSSMTAAQERDQSRMKEDDVRRLEEQNRFDALRRACQRGETGKAAGLISNLLDDDVSPMRIYGVVRSMGERIDLVRLSEELDSPGGQSPRIDNLIMILAYTMRDSSLFIRIRKDIQENRWWDPDILERLGQDALSLDDWNTARWAFMALDDMGRLTNHALILSLARAFYQTGEPDKALMMLDRLGDMSRLPRIYGDQSRILRARIRFKGDDTKEALAILSSIQTNRTREKAEAEFLSTLYEFVAYDDSAAHERLVTAAGRTPDLPETNEALAFWSLSGKIPDGSRRDEVFKAMKYELQGRFEDAARQYLETGKEFPADTAALFLIRAARCLEHLEKYEEAGTVWKELAASGEARPVALLGLGDCLSARGLADSAAVLYMELLTSFPESPHAARARNRLLR